MDYKQFRSFQYLNQTQLQNFVGACQQVIIPAEQLIVQQNSHAKKIFFVLEGEVRVFLDTSTGEKELSKLAAPTVLGEISFFSGEPNSANVITVTQVQALIMPFEVLRQRLHSGDAASSPGCSLARFRHLPRLEESSSPVDRLHRQFPFRCVLA